jgi:serine/threonine-protein kinase
VGLKSERLGEEYSNDYPESTVFIQDPQAGRTVKQGRKVFLMLSRGMETREVPLCAGRSLRAAAMFLEKVGFQVGTVAKASRSGSYPDEVLSTDPPPGSRATRGSVVNVLVSTGEPKTRYLLPDLRGKYYIQARFQIERLGIVVNESGSEDDLASLSSRIVMQQPPPGFIVARGDTVTLLVSRKYEEGVEL